MAVIQERKYYRCEFCGHYDHTEIMQPEILGCETCREAYNTENEGILNVTVWHKDDIEKDRNYEDFDFCSWSCLFIWLENFNKPFERISLPDLMSRDSKFYNKNCNLESFLSTIKDII